MDRAAAVVQLQSKSLGLGIVLTLFFGGLGMFYASIMAGVICVLIEVALVVISLLTFGLGLVALFAFHVACVIICVVIINSRNKRLIQREFGPASTS